MKQGLPHTSTFIHLQYEWYKFKNTVDKNKDNLPDYYVTTVGSTFDIINFESVLPDNLDSKGYVDALQLLIHPDDSGSQITYNTSALSTWTDIFASLGGMYEMLQTIIGVIVVYLLWGSGKFKGVYVFLLISILACILILTSYIARYLGL